MTSTSVTIIVLSPHTAVRSDAQTLIEAFDDDDLIEDHIVVVDARLLDLVTVGAISTILTGLVQARSVHVLGLDAPFHRYTANRAIKADQALSEMTSDGRLTLIDDVAELPSPERSEVEACQL